MGESKDLNLAASYELSINSKQMTPQGERLLSVLALLPEGMASEDQGALPSSRDAEAARTLRKLTLAYDEADRLRMLTPLREHVAQRHPPERSELAQWWALPQSRDVGERVGREGGAEASRRLLAELANVSVMVTRGLRIRRCGACLRGRGGLGAVPQVLGSGGAGFLRAGAGSRSPPARSSAPRGELHPEPGRPRASALAA